LANNITRAELEQIIMDVMGATSITPIVTKQINRFVIENGYTFKQIAQAIVWYDEVEHGTFKPQYGIAVVPNVMEEAQKYFKKLELDQQRQLAEAQKIVEYQDNNIIFNIKSLEHKKRKPKQLDISSIDISEGEK